MNRLLTFILLSTILSGCTNSEKSGGDEILAKDKSNLKDTHTAEKTQNTPAQTLNFKEPIYIDSTDYVMYPLSNQDKGSEDSYDTSIKTGSRGDIENYWNIAFYNMTSKTYHLLDDKQKMIITNYSALNDGESTSYNHDETVTSYKRDNIILYSIIINDYNKDGKLDLDDPTYLFISDKKGDNLRQISPNNMNVSNWKVIKQTGKILIQIASDNNHNNKFDIEDKTIPYIFDIKTSMMAEPVFSADFQKLANTLFEKQWSIKK